MYKKKKQVSSIIHPSFSYAIIVVGICIVLIIVGIS